MLFTISILLFWTYSLSSWILAQPSLKINDAKIVIGLENSDSESKLYYNGYSLSSPQNYSGILVPLYDQHSTICDTYIKYSLPNHLLNIRNESLVALIPFNNLCSIYKQIENVILSTNITNIIIFELQYNLYQSTILEPIDVQLLNIENVTIITNETHSGQTSTAQNFSKLTTVTSTQKSFGSISNNNNDSKFSFLTSSSPSYPTLNLTTNGSSILHSSKLIEERTSPAPVESLKSKVNIVFLPGILINSNASESLIKAGLAYSQVRIVTYLSPAHIQQSFESFNNRSLPLTNPLLGEATGPESYTSLGHHLQNTFFRYFSNSLQYMIPTLARHVSSSQDSPASRAAPLFYPERSSFNILTGASADTANNGGSLTPSRLNSGSWRIRNLRDGNGTVARPSPGVGGQFNEYFPYYAFNYVVNNGNSNSYNSHPELGGSNNNIYRQNSIASSLRNGFAAIRYGSNSNSNLNDNSTIPSSGSSSSSNSNTFYNGQNQRNQNNYHHHNNAAGGGSFSSATTYVSRTSILFVSISFIVLMIISLAWLVFYYVQRFRYAHAKDQLAKRLNTAAKKALVKIPLRTVKNDDKVTGPDSDACAVCIEGFKPNEIVRELKCGHYFHRVCVDTWLLLQRSCPICKLDILEAYGLSIDKARRSSKLCNNLNQFNHHHHIISTSSFSNVPTNHSSLTRNEAARVGASTRSQHRPLTSIDLRRVDRGTRVGIAAARRSGRGGPNLITYPPSYFSLLFPAPPTSFAPRSRGGDHVIPANQLGRHHHHHEHEVVVSNHQTPFSTRLLDRLMFLRSRNNNNHHHNHLSSNSCSRQQQLQAPPPIMLYVAPSSTLSSIPVVTAANHLTQAPPVSVNAVFTSSDPSGLFFPHHLKTTPLKFFKNNPISTATSNNKSLSVLQTAPVLRNNSYPPLLTTILAGKPFNGSGSRENYDDLFLTNNQYSFPTGGGRNRQHPHAHSLNEYFSDENIDGKDDSSDDENEIPFRSSIHGSSLTKSADVKDTIRSTDSTGSELGVDKVITIRRNNDLPIPSSSTKKCEIVSTLNERTKLSSGLQTAAAAILTTFPPIGSSHSSSKLQQEGVIGKNKHLSRFFKKGYHFTTHDNNNNRMLPPSYVLKGDGDQIIPKPIDDNCILSSPPTSFRYPVINHLQKSPVPHGIRHSPLGLGPSTSNDIDPITFPPNDNDCDSKSDGSSFYQDLENFPQQQPLRYVSRSDDINGTTLFNKRDLAGAKNQRNENSSASPPPNCLRLSALLQSYDDASFVMLHHAPAKKSYASPDSAPLNSVETGVKNGRHHHPFQEPTSPQEGRHQDNRKLAKVNISAPCSPMPPKKYSLSRQNLTPTSSPFTGKTKQQVLVVTSPYINIHSALSTTTGGGDDTNAI